jgi:hypothetical protein
LVTPFVEFSANVEAVEHVAVILLRDEFVGGRLIDQNFS